MNLGDAYERILRLPRRRPAKPVRRMDVTPLRRKVNAAIVPIATVLAGRGLITQALTGGGALAITGIVAAGLTAWLVALWHLRSAGRRRGAATVLGIALVIGLGCTVGMHWEASTINPVMQAGLRRGTLGALVIAAMAAVAVSMLGMRPLPIAGDK